MMRRRAGIDLQAIRVEAADDVEIAGGRRDVGVDDPGDALCRLAGLAGLDRGEVIEADAGMGVETVKGFGFLRRCSSSMTSTGCLNTSVWLPA